MKLFSPPASRYTDLYDQERFNFTWWLFMFLAVVFLFLSSFHFFRDDQNFFVTIAALGVVGICLMVTYFTRSFVAAAVVGIIGGSLVNQYDLFVIVSSQKFVTTLWIVSISLSAFYLLGSKFGFVTLLLNLIGVGTALVVVPQSVQVERIVTRDNFGLMAICINLAVITFYLSFLMHKIQQTTRTAEKRSRVAQAELKDQYQLVQGKNEEKTVMLKEIHHRVKNNLQVITSLLRLQSREIDDEKSIAYFNDAIQRVLAMALIHEKMYQSNDLSKIDLEAYLKSLTEELINTYAIEKPIHIAIKCELEYIQPKSLVSFALLCNELVANSLKHAFVNKDSGEIKIDIRLPEPNHVVFEYHDNGEWRGPQKATSFGLELIDDLCEQLDGKFTRSFENGTTYLFDFDYLNLE